MVVLIRTAAQFSGRTSFKKHHSGVFTKAMVAMQMENVNAK